jgi:hypothetical protein
MRTETTDQKAERLVCQELSAGVKMFFVHGDHDTYITFVFQIVGRPGGTCTCTHGRKVEPPLMGEHNACSHLKRAFKELEKRIKQLEEETDMALNQ